MNAKTNLIEPLFERVEQYASTNFELLKLKSLSKTADISSTLISRLFLILVLSVFALTLNIGIAWWLGDLLGKIHYGLFIVAGFYGIIAIILLFSHERIKFRIKNTIVFEMFKK